MSSGDLIPNDHDQVEPVANEVQFALVIARMIDTVKNSPSTCARPPLPDNPEMYELHSEGPALELTPARYALVMKTRASDFTVDGNPVDPKQCIERIGRY